MLQNFAHLLNSDCEMTRKYREFRNLTEWLCQPLLTEDYVIQSMPDVSPPKWHLAHTTWFFEHFLLSPHFPGYTPFHPAYGYLFNSYYKSAGPHVERSQRGLLSRPSVEEVYQYRKAVDLKVGELLAQASPEQLATLAPILTLGLNHEQQHQELLLTDIKHLLWSNLLRPAYRPELGASLRCKQPLAPAARLLSFAAGPAKLGAPIGEDRFCYDNERPGHRVFLEAYGLHSRQVSNGEFLEFIESGGYQQPSHWLSDGWDESQRKGWSAPLYWEKQDGRWWTYTLSGSKRLDEQEPVSHISYYEADAFARWRGQRLPTEAEWENAAGTEISVHANLADKLVFHPEAPLPSTPDFFGNSWEWTASAYSAYPGFKPLPAGLGEYNGKFMCKQFVLRGGSCATSASHLRPTYRNFFSPETRWQFAGMRLAV
jgi:ergothioneine biosynthesis protein EgtB